MSELDPLFYWRGIAPGYTNYKGESVEVPLENKKNLLLAMGVDLSSSESVANDIFELDVKPWLSWLTPFSLTKVDAPYFSISIHPDHLNVLFKWHIEDEKGEIVDKGEFIPEKKEVTGDYTYQQTLYSKRKVSINVNTPGYYRLVLCSGDDSASSLLAVAPTTVFTPSWVTDKSAIWGVIIHLYSLRSRRNWGIGDFTDLKLLIKFLAKYGGGVIGLNPLHALSPDLEHSFSPYTPSDRRFINPLYIDVESVAYYEKLSVSEDIKDLVADLNDAELVNYEQVARLKFSQLSSLFTFFVDIDVAQKTTDFTDFLQYVKKTGNSLLDYAFFEVSENNRFSSLHKNKIISYFGAEFQNIVDRFDSDIQVDILFYCYVQWLADIQLEESQSLADSLGMEIGLVKDLAVGADGGGGEVSTNLDLFCRDASIGAPPDPMALTGQNWGIPPMDPVGLIKSDFAHYIALLRANMSRCGALRIDHAMSLMRLWWCPPDADASEGAYVRYPFHELLGLLCLESHLNHCVIIGEDLGVVPDEFRSAIAEANIFSNKVFYFEKEFDGNFRRPEYYQKHALAMVNNHDVPTLVSWWNGTDLTLRDGLGMLEQGVSLEQVNDGRLYEKQCLVNLLSEYQLLPESWHGKPLHDPIDTELVSAILLFASRSASQIFVLQLEDLMMMDAPVNVPGTYKEYPNWQRKLVMNLEDFVEESNIGSLLQAINSQRSNV